MASHSCKYLEPLRASEEQVQFHNLYKGTSRLPESLRSFSTDNPHRDDVIFGQSAFKLEQLQPNDLMGADEKPLDMVFEEKVNRK